METKINKLKAKINVLDESIEKSKLAKEKKQTILCEKYRKDIIDKFNNINHDKIKEVMLLYKYVKIVLEKRFDLAVSQNFNLDNELKGSSKILKTPSLFESNIHGFYYDFMYNGKFYYLEFFLEKGIKLYITENEINVMHYDNVITIEEVPEILQRNTQVDGMHYLKLIGGIGKVNSLATCIEKDLNEFIKKYNILDDNNYELIFNNAIKEIEEYNKEDLLHNNISQVICYGYKTLNILWDKFKTETELDNFINND